MYAVITAIRAAKTAALTRFKSAVIDFDFVFIVVTIFFRSEISEKLAVPDCRAQYGSLRDALHKLPQIFFKIYPEITIRVFFVRIPYGAFKEFYGFFGST